jgi:outer membrane protein assembly factor BamB
MSQHPDHFTPETVDEQIERLTQETTGQQGTPDQELVQHLRHFYQTQVAEKNADPLDHAWERITQTKAYIDQYTTTQPEQRKKPERRIRIMKTLPGPITDVPYDEQDMTTSPTRIQRISRFMQSIAAVLLVGILLGGFFILFWAQHATTGGTIASKTRSIIVASTADGTIYGVQPDSGAILWQHATGQALNGSSPGENNITIQGKMVYGVEGNQAFALNALNGTLLWEKTLEASLNSYSLVQADSGVVYVSKQESGGGHTYALQANNGDILWYHPSESLLTAANSIGYTYVMDIHGNYIVKAFSSKNGQLLWQYATNVMTGVVAHDTIYLYSARTLTPGDTGDNKQDKLLLALNARTGKLLWSKPVIDDEVNPLVIVKNMLIVGSFPNLKSYRYCAYHTKDGSQIWCSEIAIDSTYGNTTKYITMGDTLYAIMLPVQSSCQLEARNISNGSLRWSHPCTEIQSLSFSIVGLNGTVFITDGGNTAAISALDSHGNIQKTFQLSNSGAIVALAVGSW